MHPKIRPCREVRCRWSTFCLHITAHSASGIHCGESGDRAVRTCEVRHAASVAGMRTVLSVKWTRYGVVDHLHADSANDCTADSISRAASRMDTWILGGYLEGFCIQGPDTLAVAVSRSGYLGSSCIRIWILYADTRVDAVTARSAGRAPILFWVARDTFQIRQVTPSEYGT